MDKITKILKKVKHISGRYNYYICGTPVDILTLIEQGVEPHDLYNEKYFREKKKKGISGTFNFYFLITDDLLEKYKNIHKL
jgi:hypothetical protein